MLRSVTVLVVLGVSWDVRANPNSVVAGGRDPDAEASGFAQKSVDVFAVLDYAYELDTSQLVRERLGPGTDPLQAVPTIRDLDFKQVRHTLTPRIEVGVYHDWFVTAALPIIIGQQRDLSLTQGVERASSTTVTDGLLTANGFDAHDPSTPTTGDLLFRGPTRSGLDQIHLGLGTALMNQAKDDTKPTWKLGAEIRLAIGQIMAFDRMAPDANKGVSRGVHELRVYTSFARKLGWAEPWVELYWLTPVAAKNDSLFQDPGFGATNTELSQHAVIAAGIELYALDNAADQTRISLDFGAKADLHFEGREYTELWELFAYAGDSRGMGPLILDADPTQPGIQPLSHPGISNVENYLETSGRLALRAQIGPHVRFAVTGDLVWKTDHAITFADAGVAIPGVGTDDLVDPGTREVNPLHVDAVDLVGHRYRSVNNFDVVVGVQGQVLF